MTDPDQAVTDAAERVAIEMRKHPVFDLSLADERLREIAFELASEAVAAARPHLEAGWREQEAYAVAAMAAERERERCAQLADEVGATYRDCPCDPERGIGDFSHKPSPFADLIRQASGATGGSNE
jgi:hypothetical protein